MEELDKAIENMLDAIMCVVHDDVTIPWQTKKQAILNKFVNSDHGGIWQPCFEELFGWFEHP